MPATKDDKKKNRRARRGSPTRGEGSDDEGHVAIACSMIVNSSTKHVTFSKSKASVLKHQIPEGNSMDCESRYHGTGHSSLMDEETPNPVDVESLSKAKSNEAAKKARWKARKLAAEVGAPKGSFAMPCATGRKWIIDSGSCFDIVNAHEMKPAEAKNATKSARPYRMITAAGVINAERETTVPLANIGSKATAIVMSDSPCVLSLGKRCMQEGFSFEWNAGENPVLVTPDGRRHILELQNLVPVMPVVKGTEPAARQAEPDASGSTEGPTPSTTASAETIPKDHCLTHFPKLAWCEVCQRAKSQRAACKRKKREPAARPAEDGG